MRAVLAQRLDRPALICKAIGSVTGADSLAALDQIILAIDAAKVAPGAAVANIAPKARHATLGFLACLHAHIAAPLNPDYTTDEFLFYLSDLKPGLVLLGEGASPAAHAAVAAAGLASLELDDRLFQAGPYEGSLPAQSDPTATGLILHTSGTTARPKMVALTQQNLATSCTNIAQSLALSAEDISLCAMPLFHIHGLMASLGAALISGGAVVLAGKFQPEAFVESLQRHGVTWFSAVPTIHLVLIQHLEKRADPLPHNLRFIRSSSASLPASVIARMERHSDAPSPQPDTGLAVRPNHDFGDYAHALPTPLQTAWGEHPEPVPELGLPFDFAPPKLPCYRGNSTPIEIDAQTWSKVEALAAELHVSPISVLLAAYRLALFEISGQRDFCIGNTAMTRDAPGVQQMLGAFVQTLPIRTPVAPGMEFGDLCQTEQTALARALEQATTSQSQALATTQAQVQNTAAAYQAVLNYRGFSTRRLNLHGCTVQPLSLSGRSTPFTLALNLEKTETGLQGELVWNAARFTPETAARITAQFSDMLSAALQSPNTAAETLLTKLNAERASPRILSCPAPKEAPSLARLLTQSFERYADQPALHCGDLHWSYAELDAASAAWAQAIMHAPGGAGDLVALALPRGAQFVAALLGILRAGRAFVPVSPEDPPERIARILKQADPKHLIAEAELAQALGRPSLSPDEGGAIAGTFIAPDAPAAEALAYVMFTSGSTGEPKGVAIPHRALANYLAAVRQVFAPTRGDRVLSASATTFDSIIYEVLMPLVSGGELVIIEAGLRRDPWHVVETMQASKPRHFFATPSLWRMLIEAGLPDMPQLKALIGGEALPPEVAKQILPRVGQLFNVYGPTEATVFSTWQEVLPQGGEDREKAPVGSKIGQPFPGYSLAVLDAQQRPVWPGMTGEIWIGGAGLASGYYKSAERTEQSFPQVDLGSQTKRWYRTGDVGRLLDDGTISCLGRLDDQVKISGQRVEPGEVENLLLARKLATGAAVFAAEITDRTLLVAFYVPQDGATEPEVRRYLQANLPAAWVPGLIVTCEVLPLNTAGKLDRRAMLVRAREAIETQGTFTDAAPVPEDAEGREAEGGLAPAVLQGWEQALGCPPANLDQDFFAAGGNSLLLITLLGRIRGLTGCHLPVAEAFGDPTPRELNALLAKTAPQDLHKIIVCAKEGSCAQPLLFLPGLIPTGPNLTNMMLEAPQDQSCYMLQRPIEAPGEPQRSFADQARCFARVLEHGFPGSKLHLTGFSYGGAEAFETARQLAALKSPPASLTIIDNAPVFHKVGQGDPVWGEQGIQAENLRRAHVFEPWQGDMKLVRGDRSGLLSIAMIAFGWEDFVEGEVAVRMVPAAHNEMLHRQAPATMAALLGLRGPDCTVTPLPGAKDRRRVSYLLAQVQPKAALDLICGISREHPDHPWSSLVADSLAISMGKDCSGLLADWIEAAPTDPPKGVPALVWHAARAQALLRLQGARAALPELEKARAQTQASGRLLHDLEAIYGELLHQVDCAQEAVEVLLQVEKTFGARADSTTALGISLAKTGQFQGALNLLRKAKDTGNCSAEVLEWLAKSEEGISASQGSPKG